MNNATKQNNVKTEAFQKVIKWNLDHQREKKNELREIEFISNNIRWNAKDLVIAEEQLSIYAEMVWDLENINSEFTDVDLTKYLIAKTRTLLESAKTYRHNSTCPWDNAINFAKNEAIIDILQTIQRFI